MSMGLYPAPPNLSPTSHADDTTCYNADHGHKCQATAGDLASGSTIGNPTVHMLTF